MAKKNSMFRGRGNFFHDSATYRLKPKYKDMIERIADLKYRDYQYALHNDLLLFKENYGSGIIYHCCLFCKEKNPKYNRDLFLSHEYRDTELLEIENDNGDLYYKCPQCHFIKIKENVKLLYEDQLEEHFIVGIIGKSIWYEDDLLKTIHLRALSKKEVFFRLFKYFKHEFTIIKNKIIIKKWEENNT